MQKIVPHLWFDKNVKEAVTLYTSIFPESSIDSMSTIRDTPSGDCDMASFRLWGYSFMAIGAGPEFRLNPSISFMVNFDPSENTDAKAQLDAIWAKLIPGGKVMMELGVYDFSKWYGWVEDKHGVSWQLILTNPEGEKKPHIIPSIMFTGDNTGKAEEATDFYMSVFADSKRGMIARYPEQMGEELAGNIMYTDFMLSGQWFTAMDSGRMHDFTFSEAISLMVNCEDQAEVDYYWGKLSAVPESEQCGWLKDKYGLSWQIVPKAMGEMMSKGTPEQNARVTQAFLKMKKFDIATLQKAYGRID
jgi:predicted 3-demethylubiquinone-9 3-methyltransferase (glyoxalase superfamily)